METCALSFGRFGTDHIWEASSTEPHSKDTIKRIQTSFFFFFFRLEEVVWRLEDRSLPPHGPSPSTLIPPLPRCFFSLSAPVETRNASEAFNQDSACCDGEKWWKAVKGQRWPAESEREDGLEPRPLISILRLQVSKIWVFFGVFQRVFGVLHTYVHELVLSVVLFAAAFPVTVGFVDRLGLLLILVSVHVLLQVQQATLLVLQKVQINTFLKIISNVFIFPPLCE